MKIAVDAMGGDFGPRNAVAGAVEASREWDVDILLVGVESLVKREFDRLGVRTPRVTIIDAPEAVGMADGVFALRRKRRSSIRVGAELIKTGRAEAMVSMGNTAAVVYLSRKILGALEGVSKPALALLVPTLGGLTLLLDVGANANCRAEDLEQFARMGKVFMEQILGLREPRIGLMSIGEEETKGNDLTKQAFDRLSAAPLNFVGNIEGKDLYAGKADVIVSDGFTGNVALKVSEGVVEHLFSLARREIMGDIFARIGFLFMRRNLRRLYQRIDYAEYGGAQLLGLNGVCIIGHGRSNMKAVKNAVRLAKDFVVRRVQDRIREELGRAPGEMGGVKIG
ncbi:MAG: phosphate acyltransferase PlsX [Candidatus Aminicenantes bacterium]|nr:phosphate acyltransferase PlsX [Candidatus Aminicenantes bacterium]